MFRLLFALPLFVRMLALDPTPDPDPKPDPPKNTDPKPDPKPGDKGYPEGTPVADMTTDQQAAYWKHHARQWEDRAKARSDYDDLKAKAAKLDEIEAANATEAEKAAKAAREEGKSEGIREAAAAGVDTHIEAAVTAGRLSQDQADVLLDGLDRTKYLTDEHRVDTAKVSALLDKIAPAKGEFPDLGQGRRHGQPKPSVDAGREMFEARRPKAAAQ